jgi:hypothetical protein
MSAMKPRERIEEGEGAGPVVNFDFDVGGITHDFLPYFLLKLPALKNTLHKHMFPVHQKTNFAHHSLF